MNESDPLRELELDASQMRRLVEAALERIVAHVQSLPRQPSNDVAGGAELARSLAEPLPEEGQPADALLSLLFDRAVPTSFNTAGPGYLAYIPGGGLFHAAVADLIADAVNRYVTVWAAAPGLAQIESNVVSWLCGMVGYPETSRGFLTSGGSLANFSALVTARRERLGDAFAGGTLYASDQVHHSVAKAALLAGFPAEAVRPVATDERFRIRLPDLLRLVREDRTAGRRPFCVVGNAGSTNTGAVDDLAGLADLTSAEGLWLHVDGAYGGFFVLTERGRQTLRGLERADSVTLDPHKGLFLPYGTGSLLVKDGAALRRTHRTQAGYMPEMQSEEFVDFCEISPELTRDFRGLRVWLPIKMHGIAAFRRALDEKLDLAAHAAETLRAWPEVEMVAEPQLSLLAFRLRPPGLVGEALDRLNQRWLEAINARRRIYLSGARVGGRFVLRICVLSFRTHRDRLEEGLEDMRQALQEVWPR